MTSSHNQIKQIIGVMSAKGGVGKSFVTSLLASGLAKEGYRVGILDADFTGSSIPMFFGLHSQAKAGEYSFLPIECASGIKIISTNLLFCNEDQSVIWKESLVGEVIKDLWKEVEWGTLDYLLVDMPPTTSEVAVEMMRSIPLMGVVIVTMPQGITTKIVNKAVFIVQNMGIHIIGVVENMAYYISPESDTKHFIFGQCHGESVANLAKAPILIQIPLDPTAAKLCDLGKIEDIMPDKRSEFTETFLESLFNLEEKESTLPTASQANNIYSFPQTNSVGRTFSTIAIQLIQSQENVGELENPDAQGFFLGSCGDKMQIDLRISEKMIEEAKFLADGCGATLACGSMITKMACSKTLDQAAKISSEDLLTALGGLPAGHEHCAELAVMTLREAVIDAVEGHGKAMKQIS
jgi:Mrp family chromosome partitioning ATPase/NifU-like protein involved in Fe-S cluster formation